MANLQGVPATLYLPLSARIYVSRRFPEFFCDEAALALEDALPEIEGNTEYTHMASVARYHNLDEMARAFAARSGRCNIVNLGCGLDTMRQRLANVDANFLEVDLPEVIEVRERVLESQPDEATFAGDMFELGWVGALDASLPTLLIVSGVFQYFHPEDVASFIAGARERLGHAELIFDATDTKGLAYANRYVRRTGNASAEMHFCVDDAAAYAREVGAELVESRTFFADARAQIGRKLGLYTRVAMWVVDTMGRGKIIHLRLG